MYAVSMYMFIIHVSEFNSPYLENTNTKTTDARVEGKGEICDEGIEMFITFLKMLLSGFPLTLSFVSYTVMQLLHYYSSQHHRTRGSPFRNLS